MAVGFEKCASELCGKTLDGYEDVSGYDPLHVIVPGFEQLNHALIAHQVPGADHDEALLSALEVILNVLRHAEGAIFDQSLVKRLRLRSLLQHVFNFPGIPRDVV